MGARHRAPKNTCTGVAQHQIEANNSVKKLLIYKIQHGMVRHPCVAQRVQCIPAQRMVPGLPGVPLQAIYINASGSQTL
jgi:hypothetical protein